MKLNDAKLRRITAQGQRIDLSDGNGLVLRVSPNGQKRWSVRYRFADKQTCIEIGTYPEVSLARARAGPGIGLGLPETAATGESMRLAPRDLWRRDDR